MAKIVKVKITWNTRSPKSIFDIIILIISGFTQYDNLFAKPPIDVAGLKDLQTDLNDKYSKRLNGDVGRNDFVDALKKADGVLREEAEYVNNLSKGDETIIFKSGFTPTKATAQRATTIPAQAGVPKAKATVGGFLYLDTDYIDGATSYTYFIFFGNPFAITIVDDFFTIPAGADSKLLIVGGGAKSLTIKGVPQGQQVYIQVLGHNSIGYGPVGPALPIFTV